jgi:hypothetical protein
MGVTTIVQQTIVDTVGSVVLSAITQDPNTFLWLRTIQVYSPPDTKGNVVLQFSLTVSGATQANVELTAPGAITLTAPSGSI